MDIALCACVCVCVCVCACMYVCVCVCLWDHLCWLQPLCFLLIPTHSRAAFLFNSIRYLFSKSALRQNNPQKQNISRFRCDAHWFSCFDISSVLKICLELCMLVETRELETLNLLESVCIIFNNSSDLRWDKNDHQNQPFRHLTCDLWKREIVNKQKM